MPSTFNPKKPFGESFSTDNDTQAGLYSVFVDLACFRNELSEYDILSTIQESMSPMQLVHPEIVKKLTIFQKIKVFFLRYGIDVPVTEESGNLLARRIVCKIWGETIFDAERSEALQFFDEIRRGNTNPPTPLSTPRSSLVSPQHEFHPQPSLRILGNDMAKRFGHDSLKFCGNPDESLDTFLDSFDRASKEMELSPEQKVNLVHHVFRGQALDFYRNEIEMKNVSWEEAVVVLSNEYNSEVRMETMNQKLKSLRISDYEKNGISEEEALNKLAKDIQEIIPQIHKECRTDRYKKGILQDATRGRRWALQVTSSSNFRNMNYQLLLQELHNALQQFKFHENTESSDNGFILRTDRTSHVNFIGQGKLKGSLNYQKKSFTCWNCGKQNCSVSRCPQKKDYERIRANRVAFFESKKGKLSQNVRETLFEFSTLFETEDQIAEFKDDEKSIEENQIFEEGDEKAFEIQHALANNRFAALGKNNETEDLGF